MKLYYSTIARVSIVEQDVMKTKALLANVASKAFRCVYKKLIYSKPVDV